MAVATFEDLQGTLEVVVFPRMYATSGGTFAEGAILLVAGRIDHRGEEASLLADAVWVWEDAATRGPAAIAQEVAAGERGQTAEDGAGRRAAATGNGNGNGRWQRRREARGVPAAGSLAPDFLAHRRPMTARRRPRRRRAIRVSPLRGGGVTVLDPAGPPPLPAEPLSAAPSPDDLATLAPDREEPPLPDEARAVAARASAAPTAPLEAPESGILAVRFTRGADTSRIVWAMEELRAMLKQRPGSTRVVFHIPGLRRRNAADGDPQRRGLRRRAPVRRPAPVGRGAGPSGTHGRSAGSGAMIQSGGSSSAARELAQRLLRGRLRYPVLAAIVVLWVLVGILVAMATSGGLVFF